MKPLLHDENKILIGTMTANEYYKSDKYDENDIVELFAYPEDKVKAAILLFRTYLTTQMEMGHEIASWNIDEFDAIFGELKE